jgi:hypothetical protein
MAGNFQQDYRRSNVTYASVSLTTSGNEIDFDIRANTTLFSKVKVAREIVIRNTHPAYIKFNDVENDAIEVFAREGLASSGMPIENIYITTVAGCHIRVYLIGWN